MVDFIRRETARSGGDPPTSHAIGNEGLLKLSKRLEAAGTSIQPHLHRDPDQVRMVLGAKLLLEQ